MNLAYENAVKLIEKGKKVIVLGKNSKIPVRHELQLNGTKTPVSDVETLKNIFMDNPDGNIGLLTGEINDLTVVDIDGKEAMKELEKNNIKFPHSIYRVKTRRGFHIYLKYDENLKQTANLLDKLDIRSTGGYVVSVGSQVDGHIYKAQNSSQGLGEWKELTEFSKNKTKKIQTTLTEINKDQPSWVSEALSTGAGEGNRNDLLARLSGYFNAKKIPYDLTLQILEQYRTACNPEMGQREFENTIKSVYRYIPSDNKYIGVDLEAPIVDYTVANRMGLRWPSEDVIVDLSHIKADGNGINVWIKINSHQNQIFAPRRVNLLSTSATEQLRRELQQSADKNWRGILNMTTNIISDSLENSSETYDMRFYKKKNENTSWVARPIAQKNMPTLFYGMGGEGKSTVAIAILLSVATGVKFIPQIDIPETPQAVMFADWEDAPDQFSTTMNALLKGKGMKPEEVQSKIIYKRFVGSLADHIDEIQRDVAESNVGLVVVDSLVASSGSSDVNDPESAKVWFSSMSSLKDVASIGITHVSKGGNGNTPFGSVYFWNFARSVWEITADEDVVEKDTSMIAISNRKSNRTSQHKPIGLNVTFINDENDVAELISYEETDLGDSTNLVAKLSNKERVLREIRQTPKTLEEIYELLPDIKQATIRSLLSRMVKSSIVIKDNSQYIANKNDFVA